jgi:hypothetical protein
MKKTSLLAAAAAMALSSAAFAGPSAAGYGIAAKVVNNSPLATLVDQTGTDSGIGITSQNFEASFDQYDNMGADDFTVPAGFVWKVTQVNASGVYYNGSGPASSVHVTFYKNDGGLPGAVVKDFPAVVPTTDNFGSFGIKLPSAVKLKKGKYWVSVQANMDFAIGGQWGWNGSTVQNGAMAAWQNPGDGFATGCTTWTAESTCIPSGQGPDKAFSLIGKAVPK